jgi:hypothetical protein
MAERARMRMGAAALVPVVMAAGLAACGSGAEAADASQTMREYTSARQADGEESLNVSVQYGAGRLELKPGAPGLLYRLQMRYDEQAMTPVAEYAPESGRLRLGLTGRTRRGVNTRGEGGRATVELSPTIPMDLKVEFGAAEADLELGGLALRSLEVSTGASSSKVRFGQPNAVEASEVRFAVGAASLEVTGLANARAERYRFQGGVGETTLAFDGEWTRNADVKVEVGVGSARLRFPRGVGVRIERRGVLSSFDPAGMARRADNAWYSEGWDTAEHRLNVSIESAIGSVDVSWLD